MFVANDGAGILKRFEWVVVVVVGGGSPGSFLWSGIVHGLLLEGRGEEDWDRESGLKGADDPGSKRLRQDFETPSIGSKFCSCTYL